MSCLQIELLRLFFLLTHLNFKFLSSLKEGLSPECMETLMRVFSVVIKTKVVQNVNRMTKSQTDRQEDRQSARQKDRQTERQTATDRMTV